MTGRSMPNGKIPCMPMTKPGDVGGGRSSEGSQAARQGLQTLAEPPGFLGAAAIGAAEKVARRLPPPLSR